MDRLGVIGLSLAVLVIVGLVLLLRSRRPPADTTDTIATAVDLDRPRTVAELVAQRGTGARPVPEDARALVSDEFAEDAAAVEPDHPDRGGPVTDGTEPVESAVLGDVRPSAPAAAAPTVPPVPTVLSPPWRRVRDDRHPPPAPRGEQAVANAPTTTEPVRPAAREAERAAVDLALLRVLGFADPDPRPSAAPIVAAARSGFEFADEPAYRAGVAFRVTRRDDAPVPDAAVTLLDGGGRDVGKGITDGSGRGVVASPGAGDYVLVCCAAGHQPRAVALTVGAEPVEVAVLLAGSSAVAGTVRAAAVPLAGVAVTLLQDDEVVDVAQTAESGRYRIGDLAAGEYTLTVVSAERDPVTVVVRVPEQVQICQDVDLRCR